MQQTIMPTDFSRIGMIGSDQQRSCFKKAIMFPKNAYEHHPFSLLFLVSFPVSQARASRLVCAALLTCLRKERDRLMCHQEEGGRNAPGSDAQRLCTQVDAEGGRQGPDAHHKRSDLPGRIGTNNRRSLFVKRDLTHMLLWEKEGKMALDDHFASIQVWLATEEQATAHHDVFALTERLERRNAIRTHLAHLLADIERAAARLDRLPALPELSCLRWAHSVFAYPNGRILVVDSLFPAESAVLVQVLVLDFAGQVRLHRCVTPGDTLSQADRTRLGISVQELQEARSLPPIWPELLAALHGCYLLAADLRQTRLVLEQEAQRFGLEPPVCIGDDLLTWAIRWYQQSGRTSLSSLCELIGHPLPPDASITVRARGQLALLKAMARGRDQGEDDPHSPQARALEENRDDAQ